MSNSLTIDEAVARMLNIDELPPDVEIVDYLDAIADQADTDLENAKLKQESTETFEHCLKAAELRYQLAQHYKNHLLAELDRPSGTSLIKKSDKSSRIPHIELKSLEEWASRYYCIGRLDYEELKDRMLKKPITNKEIKAAKIAKTNLPGNGAKRLYILFAHSLALYVKAAQNKIGLGTPDAINVSQVAETLRQSVLEHSGNDTKFSVETIKTEIEIAIAMKNLFR